MFFFVFPRGGLLYLVSFYVCRGVFVSGEVVFMGFRMWLILYCTFYLLRYPCPL